MEWGGVAMGGCEEPDGEAHEIEDEGKSIRKYTQVFTEDDEI